MMEEISRTKNAQCKKSYIIMGIKHSGKSTQGRLLAKKLNCDFFDTDNFIEQMTKKTPRKIYNELGAEAFKDAELAACKKIASICTSNASCRFVIATGGGICDNQNALDVLRPLGVFVFLEIAEKIPADRIVRKISVTPEGIMENLPAYIKKENPKTEKDVREIFHAFYERRTASYNSIADISIKMEAAPPWKNSLKIFNLLQTEYI